MLDLLEQVYLLEDLPSRELILHVLFINGLDGYLLACEFVYSKRDLTKGSFANQFDKFVEIKRGLRQFVLLLNVILDVLNELFTFFK